ncbi:MAG: AAA family ATPase [Gammaproteobacteria bacterium]
MKFSDLVNQSSAMLRESTRVTLRGLKREFEIDDETLADLIDELTDARRIARVEDGRILVLIEDNEPISTAQYSQNRPTQTPSVSRETEDKNPILEEGERRHLTVMFADVVGSTDLADQLEPESFRNLILSYQNICQQAVTDFDGHIAQYLGDGILIYFGYPYAHENDAERAIRTGMSIISRLSSERANFEKPLNVRIGIHTGTVVVGTVGEGDNTEHLALGGVPAIASRIQMEAEMNELLISGATFRLVLGLVEADPLGRRSLKGISNPPELFRVRAISENKSRIDLRKESGLQPLVGRDSEITLLKNRWSNIVSGSGHAVHVAGEPGIGKSRLIQELKEFIDPENFIKIEFRCSPYHQNSSLYPISEHLRRLIHEKGAHSTTEKWTVLRTTLAECGLDDDQTVLLIGNLVGLKSNDAATKITLSPEQQKQKILSTLIYWLVWETKRSAGLVIFEDLHWADPTSLEYIGILLQQLPSSNLLLLLTYRPEFVAPWNRHSWQSHIILNRLTPDSTGNMVERIVGGKRFPVEVLKQITSKTDGVPLFIEELTKHLLESQLLEHTNDGYELSRPLPPFVIPSTLQDSLIARLDRLEKSREIAQIGSALGREFDFQLLAAVTALSERELTDALQELIDAELLYPSGLPPDSTYYFKHALIQDAAYQSILRSNRQNLHLKIAEIIEKFFPEYRENQPELLAFHYSEANMHQAAIEYWLKAGTRAVKTSANVEAVHHLREGLSLIRRVSGDAERNNLELMLQSRLGPPLIATKGYGASETAQCWDRARELTDLVKESEELFPVLYGCWVYKLTWAEFPTTRELADEFIKKAKIRSDSGAILTGYRMLGFSESCLGEFKSATDKFENVLKLYNNQAHQALAYRYGQDPRAAATAMLAWNAWHLGYPDKALEICNEAVEMAVTLNHTNTRGYVETFGMARILMLTGDYEKLAEHLDVMTQLCSEHQLVFWEGFVKVFRGYFSLKTGKKTAALGEIEAGLNCLENTGTAMLKPHCYAILAEALAALGRVTEALSIIDEAITVSENTSEYWVMPELLRLKGEFTLLDQGLNSLERAAKCFGDSTAAAKSLNAKGWQLRTATSLASILKSQNRPEEAREQLGSILRRFTEGFATRDLSEAVQLMSTL